MPSTQTTPVAPDAGPLLRIEAGGCEWGVPLSSIEKVSRTGDLTVDRAGSQALVHDEQGPVPLAELEGSDVLGKSSAPDRVLWLRHGEERLALSVDTVGGQFGAGPLFGMPRLPFSVPQPILGLAGGPDETLPVLDLERLHSPLPLLEQSSLTPPPSLSPPQARPLPAPPSLDSEPMSAENETSAAALSPTKGTTTKGSSDAELMLLPALGGTPDLDGTSGRVVPALSVAQVLGFEAPSKVTPLPSLPPWCGGVGWWRGQPIGVFDLASRLADGADSERGAGRWLIAAVPGGGRLALAVNGRCTPADLPARASVTAARGALADAVLGLFETEHHRLALLDLARWQRASH